jgi:hypothetical protein
MSRPFDMPAGLTLEAQQELERWDAERQGLVAEIKKIPLRILVWGPGTRSSSPVARKRIAIRDALVAEGFLAVFSEIWKDSTPSISQKTNELTQALGAKLIIILIEDSPGGLGEMHDFSGLEDIIKVMYVMSPRRYSDGYSMQGVGAILDRLGNLHLYEEGDITSCSVLTRAVERAYALREIAAYRMLLSKVH